MCLPERISKINTFDYCLCEACTTIARCIVGESSFSVATITYGAGKIIFVVRIALQCIGRGQFIVWSGRRCVCLWFPKRFRRLSIFVSFNEIWTLLMRYFEHWTVERICQPESQWALIEMHSIPVFVGIQANIVVLYVSLPCLAVPTQRLRRTLLPRYTAWPNIGKRHMYLTI